MRIFIDMCVHNGVQIHTIAKKFTDLKALLSTLTNPGHKNLQVQEILTIHFLRMVYTN